jgi:hypothetical protein
MRLRIGCWWMRKWQETGKKLISNSFVIPAPYQIFFGWWQQEDKRVTPVACVVEKKNSYRISVGKPEETRNLERPRNRWNLMIQWFLKKLYRRPWNEIIWLKTGTSGWPLWKGNEASGCMKSWKFLDYLRKYWLSQRCFALWSLLVIRKFMVSYKEIYG